MLPRVLLLFATIASVARALNPENYHVDAMLNAMPWLHRIPHKEKQTEYAVCNTETCKFTADTIKNNMNSSADPCVDFYEYACGSWRAKKSIPPSETTWDQFRQLQKKLNGELRHILEEAKNPDDILAVKAAKQLYAVCMNTDEIERVGILPLERIIDKNCGWPIIMETDEWNPTSCSWQQVSDKYIREYNAQTLFEFGVGTDLKNATANVMSLDQPSFILPRSMLINRKEFRNQIAAYTDHIVEVAMAFVESRGSKVPRERILMDAKDIVDFEIELAKITVPDEMRRNIDRMYNRLTIQQLQRWYDGAHPDTPVAKINWLKTIQNLFNEVKIKIEITDKILVIEMDYIFKLARLLDKTPARVIVNYHQWRMVSGLLMHTNKKMGDISFALEKELFGSQEQHPRWQICVTENEMSHAVAYQYVKEYFPGSSKTAVLEMVGYIKQVLEGQISKADWMDENTKLSAKEKLRSVVEFIGFPDWYKNASAVIHHYKGLRVGMVYFDNVMNYKKYLQRRMLRKFGKPVDKDEWQADPITINAFYSPSLNSLLFPAAILQAPFFSSSQPESINYGSIGSFIGHEISHGFDDVGRQFDKNGNAVQWWSDATIKAYNERAACFVEQFNRYTIEELEDLNITINANGDLTQGENIADTTGLQAVYEVFRKRAKERGDEEPRLPGLEDLNHDQLFFLSFANTWCDSVRNEYLLYTVKQDEHSTSRLRVIGTVSNVDGFSKAFNCPAGSPMNPESKCYLWK